MKAVFALFVIGLSSSAPAACYLIYTPANELVWRATTPPVAMDTLAINAAVQQIVPRGHLVISNNDTAPCRAIDLTGPRKTLRQRVEQAKSE